MRIALELSYDGTAFCGWQRQNNAPTVQEELENALSTLTRAEIQLVGCGRTDTGVHAQNFIAHTDVPESVADDLLRRMNNMLPDAIVIDSIFEVPADFNARFDALSRTYKYYILQKREVFNRNYTYLYFRHLDVDKMNEAAGMLCNYSEFGAFCKSHADNKTNRCDVQIAQWEKEGDLLTFTIKADRFLRNMVRAIVGTLVEVGENKIDLKEFESIVESQDRQQAGYSVPAKGLFLHNIDYDRTRWKLIQEK